MPTMGKYALDWATRGFRIFPLHPGTKRPVWRGWTQDATSNPERIREIWSERDYNIGVLTGKGLLVVDVDVKNGKNGLMSFMDLGIPADTLCVRTPSGGFHYYYQTDVDVANSSGKIGEGLDVRGKNGYTIAPGSVIGNNAYSIYSGVSIGRLESHFTALCGAPRERSADVIDVELDDPSAIAFAQQWLDQRAPATEGRGGDAHTYATAARLKDFGLSEEAALGMLVNGWNGRCDPPWEHIDLQTKVANAYAYGTSTPGSAAPQHIFGDVVVPEGPDLRKREPLAGWYFRRDEPGATVEWLYPDTLPTTGVCLFTGPSGGGKTFVSHYLASSLAYGNEFFSVPPTFRGATLILCGEAYGSTILRLQALPQDAPVAARYVGALAARGALEELGAAMREAAAEMQAAYRLPVRLIILDTLSSCGILENENDNAQAANVMKLFAEISQQMNALVLVIHHPSKSGEGERGAGAIKNNADYVLAIRREGTSAVREIAVVKSRDHEERELGTFTLVPVDVTVGGKAKKTMRVSPGGPRVREVRAGSAHAGLFMESLEFAWTEHAETIAGGQWVLDLHVEKWFVERWTGDKRQGHVYRTFRASAAYCADLGSAEALRLDKKTYFRKRDLGGS